MATRICAAGVAALLSIASVLAPAATSAEPGGLRARPAPLAGPARAPAVRQPARSALPAAGFGGRVHGMAPRHHRRQAGFGVTGWGWGGGYGAFYDPSNYVMLHDQPPAQPSPPAAGYPANRAVNESLSITVRVIPPVYDHRLGCQSQAQHVPEGAGERAITIMRC
jgi:hypothetical protein